MTFHLMHKHSFRLTKVSYIMQIQTAVKCRYRIFLFAYFARLPWKAKLSSSNARRLLWKLYESQT